MSTNTALSLSTNEKKRFDFSMWIIIYLTLGLFVFLSVSKSNFLTFSNIHSILFNVSFNYFAAIGFTLLIITGELDMSIGSLFGFGGAMMSFFVFSYRMPVVIAIICSMLAAAFIGSTTGFLIVKFKLNSMMVSIGVMMVVKGINWIFINKFAGRQLAVAARSFVSVNIFGIRWTIVAMIVTTIIFEIFLNKSKFLKQLYYMGQNVNTSIIYGLNTGRVKCVCFAVSAMLSAFGGAAMTARLAHPNVSLGNNLEINIITAAVIGGASIFGGRGSMLRTMMGIFFVFLLQNGMTSFNVHNYVQHIIMGVMLILAIYLDVSTNAKRT
jgi:ribose transport system permease protein